MLTITLARIKYIFSISAFLILSSIVTTPLVSAKDNIPDDLKQWQDWVLKDLPSIRCPFLYNNNKNFCAYPDSLLMDMKKKSGTFQQIWNVYAESWVSLPGDNIHWPKNVKVNGQAHVVISLNNIPSMRLEKGRYNISGKFSWQQQPKSLSIPKETGIIKLTLNNKRINLPDFRKGKLWLKSTDTKSQHTGF